MIYKGYVANVRLDEAAGVLHGEIANIHDVVTFEAGTVQDLQHAFRDSVEDYIEFCRSRGETPDEPVSSEICLQLPPLLHHRLLLLSSMAGQELNDFLQLKLEQMAASELHRRDYVTETVT